MRKTIGDLVLLFAVLVQAYSQCCLSFRGGSCVQCPPGMHLYRNNCLFDTPNCIEYQEGFDCLLCKQGYTLTNGDCFHPRLNLEQQQVGPFTPYLHSAIKPDTMFQSAQHMVRTDLQLWVSWYNHSSIKNRTFLSSNTLLRKAEQLQRRVMDSTLHYICTSTYSLNGRLLHLYRLTYQVSNPYGFADLLLAIEPEGQGVGYLEIVKVTISQLGGGNWYLLDEGTAVRIGQVLGGYFTEIKEEALMNGFWQQVGEGYNMTLFYLDGSRGVLAYSYQATKEDLGIDAPTVDNSPELEHGTNFGNSNITDKGNNTVGSQSESVNTSTASNVAGQSTPPANSNASAGTGNGSEAGVESMVSVEEVVSNPIYSTGYAVAIQQGYVDSQAQVEGLSYFPYNNSYGIYFLSPQFYSKLVFYIDLSIQEFRVASFLKSSTSLLPPSATNNSNNSHGENTPSESPSSGSFNNKTVPSNSSNNNNSPSKDTSNSNISPGDNSNTSPSNSSSKDSAITVDLNSTLIDCPQLSLFQNVSLQGQFQSDIFLPKINLLLFTLYPAALSNCQLAQASYSWRVGESALVSTIHYDLQYDCTDGGLSFGAEITNNELKIVISPQGIQEGGTASLAANSTAGSAANSNSPSTAQTESKSEGGNSSQPAIVVTPVIVTNNSKPINNNNTAPPSTKTSADSSIPRPSQPANANGHFVIIDNIRPSSFFDSLVTNGNSSNTSKNSANTSNNSSSIKAGTSPNQTSNFNSTSSDNKSQPTASNSSTNNDPFGTNTDINNATTSNDSDDRTTVDPQSYKKDPQIRTLLQIIRDTRPIPRNATVYTIERWTGAQQTDNYQVVFQVALKQVLNGSNFKMLTVKVKVLPGSLRQLQISEPIVEYQYRPTTSNLLTSTGTLYSQTVAGQSYTVEGQAGVSPLLGDGQFRHLQVSRLEQKLVEHSPYLRSSISSSVSRSQLSTSFKGLKMEYLQLLRFQSAQYLVCFRVNYGLVRDELQASDERLQLQEYEISDCEDSVSGQVGLDAIRFRDVGGINVNSSMLRRLQAIAKGNTTILSYQEHNSIYRVRFVSSRNQKYQVIIDQSKGLVISYRHTPTTTYHHMLNSHSPQKKNKDSPPPLNDHKLLKDDNNEPQDIWMRDLKDAIGRGGQFGGNTRVLKVEQTQSDSRNIILLQVMLAQHLLLDWGILLNNYYRLSILEAVSPPSITILNIAPLNITKKSPQLVLSYRGLENSHQIPLERLVATPQLASIISQVKRSYPSFLMGCRVLLCLVNTPAEEKNYFNTSYSESVNLRIVVSKKYTSNYYASYLVTIDYRPQAGSVAVTGVQALSNNAILAANCLTNVYHQGVPLCEECSQGYQLFEGVCYGSIEGCQQMYKEVCLECSRGQTEGSCAGEEVGKSVEEYIMAAGG